MALILGRREGESIQIGHDILVIVTRIDERRVSIAIDAPLTTPIVRRELLSKNEIRVANKKAA